jgi:hypothetical protein
MEPKRQESLRRPPLLADDIGSVMDIEDLLMFADLDDNDVSEAAEWLATVTGRRDE